MVSTKVGLSSAYGEIYRENFITLLSRLCAANPQFTASVLEDYIRPIFREGDVVLEIECGTNAAVM